MRLVTVWTGMVALGLLAGCVGNNQGGLPPDPYAGNPPPASTALTPVEQTTLSDAIKTDPSMQEACTEGMMGKCPAGS